MKLKDLQIGTQLRLGLGLILALVVLLGTLAWVQTDRLAEQTQTMYDHPLQVRGALGKFEADVERMSGQARELFLARNDQERAAALQSLAVEQADAQGQLAVLFDRYLGPREDLTSLQESFIKWNSVRDETLRLLQAGKTAEAAARIRSGGDQTVQAAVVRECFQKVDAFARNKSEQLHQSAIALNVTTDRQSAALVAVILLLSLGVAWFLLKAIKDPLQQLTTVAEQLRTGKMEVRSPFVSANEIGTLSAAFNTMADTIQTEMRINESAATLAGVMLREAEVQAFCRELLKALLEHTGSQVGAVYFLNEAQTAFEHFQSIGLGVGGRAAFSAAGLEGELGAALATRQIQRITDIPADTRFAFAAAIGNFTPREILTIPVVAEQMVTAVISLASVRAYDAPSVRLIQDIWSVLTARVNGVLAFRKIKNLVAQLEQQNRELAAQQQELVLQSSELTEQNTELAMQKQQLNESNGLKRAFLSNMSHELRTPLNSVIALAGVLNRRLAQTLPAEELSYLEIIERNGKNLLALINDVLDLSRIEAGREEISLQRFALRELADEVVAMIQPQAVEKGLTLASQVGDDLPPLTSDFTKCRHILQNLVGNAVKFTAQGQVTLSARHTDGQIHIAVADTGIGIAPEHLPHIFDEFRQADGSTSRKYGGTGLGLTIARKFARLLGGGITVASAPDKGSTFTLQLPLVLAAPGTSEPAQTPTYAVTRAPAPALAGRGHNILVVEDSEPAIIQLTDILQAEGYHVLVARNGREALQQIAQTVPDAMILDLMMPEVDGFDVLKAVRGTARTAQLPVLILTAKHVNQAELSFLTGNHIHQLIQKGDVNRQELLGAVSRMVAPPVPTRTPRRRAARPGKPLVLVVEDNPDSLRTARALLSERYEVIEATDGRAGVEQARQHQPDLILLDIAMPVLDGLQTLREIRRDESLRHIPVLAATASAMKGDRETILAHGFDGYLSKPMDAELLMQTLREALD